MRFVTTDGATRKSRAAPARLPVSATAKKARRFSIPSKARALSIPRRHRSKVRLQEGDQRPDMGNSGLGLRYQRLDPHGRYRKSVEHSNEGSRAERFRHSVR